MNAREILENEAREDLWSHAYLFIGSDQCEAKKLIEFIAQKKNCLELDIISITPEGNGKSGEIKVDQIRELIHQVGLTPQGNCRLAIIYNCERLNSSSGNILLKCLEEPVGNTTFLLVAERDSVLPTIKSRCRVIYFKNNLVAENKSNYLAEFNKGFFAFSKKIEEIIKEERTEEFLDDLRSELRDGMTRTKDVFYSEAIKKVEQTRKNIQANLNSRLALECLALELQKSLKI